MRALRPTGVNVVADFVGANLQATLAVLAGGGRTPRLPTVKWKSTGRLDVGLYGGAVLQELAELVDSRKMRVEVAEVFPLDKAEDAFQSNMAGHARDKIVVAVDQGSGFKQLAD